MSELQLCVTRSTRLQDRIRSFNSNSFNNLNNSNSSRAVIVPEGEESVPTATNTPNFGDTDFEDNFKAWNDEWETEDIDFGLEDRDAVQRAYDELEGEARVLGR